MEGNTTAEGKQSSAEGKGPNIGGRKKNLAMYNDGTNKYSGKVPECQKRSAI